MILLVFAVIVVAVVFLFFYFTNSDLCDNEYGICCAPLPQERKTGVELKLNKTGGIDVGLRHDAGQGNTPTEAQLRTFLHCVTTVSNEMGRRVSLTNIVRLPEEPIGQVRNRWAREQDRPQLAWTPSDSPRLSLLRIGEEIGTKADIIRRWCKENASCVKCEPSEPNEQTSAVTVTLKPNAQLERKEMRSTAGERWPVPPPGTAKPWQDIDDNGIRYFLVCRRE